MAPKKMKANGKNKIQTKASPKKAAKKAAPPVAKTALKASSKMVASKTPAHKITKKAAKDLKPVANVQLKKGAKPDKTLAPAKPAARASLEAKPGKTTRSARASRETVAGPPVCREVACELAVTTGDYCRMHYIKNWKKVKRREIIIKERKLNNYIEELVSKYPDKYIEAIRQDLSSEKDFSKVIADLEIDSGLDDLDVVEATESAEGIIDNLKRDFDDDDAF